MSMQEKEKERKKEKIYDEVKELFFFNNKKKTENLPL